MSTNFAMLFARYRSVIAAAGMTLGISLLLTLLALNAAGGDPLTFASIGTRFTNRVAAVPVVPETVGYDGQFVYYIARFGWDSLPLQDGPSFRFQRILLPVLGRGLAGLAVGAERRLLDPAPVAWALLAINLLAHATGAGLMAALTGPTTRNGLLAGLTYGLWIGMLLAVRLTLTEVLCFALGLAAILTYLQRRFRLTILLLILATLSKELGLIFAAGLALHHWFNPERIAPPATSHQRLARRGWSLLFVAAPGLTLLLWWLILRQRFGDIPTQYIAARQMTILPFTGILSAALDPFEFIMLLVWFLIPTALLLVLTARMIWHTRRWSLATSLLTPALLFAGTIPAVTWGDPAAAYRVGMPVIIAGLLLLAEHHPPRLKWYALVWLSSLLLLPVLAPLWFG